MIRNLSLMIGTLACVAVACVSFAQQRQSDSVADTKSLDGTVLLPLEKSQRPMEVTDGESEGRSLTLSVQPAKADGSDGSGSDGSTDGLWGIQMGNLNSLFVRRTENNDVVIDRLVMPDRNWAVTYNPPVPLLRHNLVPDRENIVETHAEVVDLQSGEVLYEGPAKHAINFVTSAELTLPVGKTKVTYVGINHVIELDNATVDIDLEQGYVPGVGIVYRKIRITIDKPMWMGSTTTRTVEATELPRQQGN